MSYLIDSDWVIDYLLGRPDAVGLLGGLQRTGIAISVITNLEIAEGILGNKDPARARQVYRAFLRRARVLVVNRAITDRAAAIRFALRRQGRPVDHRVLDIVIAATALEHRLTRVTRNTGDYEDIAGLLLYQHTQVAM